MESSCQDWPAGASGCWSVFPNASDENADLGNAPLSFPVRGIVYRARDRYTDRYVALKLPHPELHGSPSWERFDREARILAELQHPGIVAYVAHGQTPSGQRYIAMEWLDGETLAHRLASRRLSLAESLTCLRATANALQVAHRRGIIHRERRHKHKIWLRNGDIVDCQRRSDYECTPFAHVPA